MSETKLNQLVIQAEKSVSADIAIVLENSYPPPLSVSHFEEANKKWATTALYNDPIDQKIISKILCETLEISPESMVISIVDVEDIDWVSHVQKGLKPVRAGRFFIYGNHDSDKAINEPFAIEIDASQAFGTAHHETTKGCLEAIDQLAGTIDPTTILDLGTGTGILAIAATSVWPEARLIASDIDPIAIDIANRNITLNANTANIKTLCCEGMDDPKIQTNAPYNLLIANILAKPLIAMAGGVASAVAKEGTLLLSGILGTQAEDVINAYEDEGLTHGSTTHIDEWVTIIFTMPA